MNEHLVPQTIAYGDHIFGIDLWEGREPGRSCAYLIQGEQTVLIDTGSSICHPYLLKGLHALGVKLDEIKHVIITHIHLDHSGGLGKLLPLLPNAIISAHARGARHLIDPTRLIAGAKQAWGDQLDQLFGEIFPIPQERVVIRQDCDTLNIGNGRYLTFLDTPGHAKHHLSIWDSASKSLFCGDTFGIRYVPEKTGWSFNIVYPSTSPSDFDPDAVAHSGSRALELRPKRLFHTHFGPSDQPELTIERVSRQVCDFKKLGKDALQSKLHVSWESLAEMLRLYIRQDLADHGYPPNLSLDGFEMDIELNAKGILSYLSS